MEHYSSVRSKDDPGDGPAHLFHRSKLLHKSSGNGTTDNNTKGKKKTPKSVEEEICKETADQQQVADKKEDIEIFKTIEEKIATIKTSTGYEVLFEFCYFCVI